MARQNQTDAPKMIVHQIYLKSQGLVVQGLPEHYTKLDFKPVIDIKANPRFIDLEAGRFEVILQVHLLAKINDSPVFEAQLEQAGLFALENMSANHQEESLHGHCPNFLFPYVGVNLNLFLAQSGLPPVYLSPLDFVNLYQHHKALDAKKKTEKI